MRYLERFVVVIGVLLLTGTLAVGYERGAAAPTPMLHPAREPSATQPSPVQTWGAVGATNTAGQPLPQRASGRHPRPEELVRLPRQIQDQVARTVLTPAPRVNDGEILTLPWQIQEQVRQVQLTPPH